VVNVLLVGFLVLDVVVDLVEVLVVRLLVVEGTMCRRHWE
jgi:hypothetical protein